MATTWFVREFAELTLEQLYAILQLRERVFVVEQKCAYIDADGADPACKHLWAERDGEIVAYLRVVPAGVKFVEVSIGRVITASSARGTGLGRELMKRGIAEAGGDAQPIRIGAQAHLSKWYGELGFEKASDVYWEDGIAHIEMVRPATT
jgi:ElaA protein